ncbi:MAG: TerC family protein [Solirubrobacteraceae bacterium]
MVFAANAFALLGLRPLFFLVAELVERLYYLETALAALLVFIGLKMAAAEFVGKIGPEISLPVIAAILGTGVIASLLRDRSAGRGVGPPGEELGPLGTGEAAPGDLAGVGSER